MPPKGRGRGKSVLGRGRKMMRTSATRKRVQQENTGDQIQEVSLPIIPSSSLPVSPGYVSSGPDSPDNQPVIQESQPSSGTDNEYDEDPSVQTVIESGKPKPRAKK